MLLEWSPPQQEEVLRPTFLTHPEQNSDSSCVWVVVLLNANIFLNAVAIHCLFLPGSLLEALSLSELPDKCLVTFSHVKILVCT